jgi:outer membrane protein OmpA-like peptidoglycan-associated protein
MMCVLKHKREVLLLLLLLCATTAVAQDTTRTVQWYGSGYAGLGLNQHSTSMKGLEGVPSCCPGYESGSGNGINARVQWLRPIALNNDLCLGVEVGYENKSGILRTIETETVDDNGRTLQGEFEHSINAVLPIAMLNTTLRYRVWNQIHVSGGIGAGLLMSPTFTSQERILRPQTLVYENGKDIRNEFGGDLPSATALQAAFFGAVSYRLPVASNLQWHLVPELRFTQSLRSVIASNPWSIQTISVGIGIEYTHVTEDIHLPIVPPPPPDTPRVIAVVEPPIRTQPKTELVKALELTLTKEDGKAVDTVTVTNIVATTMFALMNYFFFDSLSSELPPRYQQLTTAQAESFIPSQLEGKGTFGIYYNMLNTLGYRMRNTTSTITLIGCNSNTDTEKNNLELSKARAESVKKYLTDVWKINPSRIAVTARNLPETPSNPVSQYGIVENRRVEVQFNDLTLFEPLSFKDTSRTLSNLTMSFSAGVECEAGIDTWEFAIMQNKKKLTAINGRDSIPTSVQQQWDERKITIPESGTPLIGRLTIRDRKGNETVFETKPVTVQQNTEQKFILKKFSLIVFKFKESAVSPLNELILNVVRKQIEPNSIVTVTGHTDIYGSPQYNQLLSERRAMQIANLLKLPPSSAKGVGGLEPLHDNTLPEGRFYSRTVQINIETPLK